MDSKTALDNIKAAELKAKELIEQAKKEAQDILGGVSLKQAQIIKQAQGQALLDAEKLREKIYQEAQEEIGLIQEHGQEEIKALREKAQRNIDRAVEFIKNKMDTK